MPNVPVVEEIHPVFAQSVAGGIVTIIIVVYIVVHRGGGRSKNDTVSVSVPRAQNIQLFLFI